MGTVVSLRHIIYTNSMVKVMTNLRSLKHLRTLHIRNRPIVLQDEPPGSTGCCRLSDNEISEVLITMLLRALVAEIPEQPPILETIALGILRYKDICAGKASQLESKIFDELFKLRVYHVEYQRNFQGDCIPMFTLIAKGTTDAINHICDNIKILQSDWLA